MAEESDFLVPTGVPDHVTELVRAFANRSTVNGISNAINSTLHDNGVDLHGNGTSWPDNESDVYRKWERVLYSRVLVVICIFGVIGNLLNLLVLSMKKFSGYGEIHELGRSANIGLLALSFSDLMVCISLIPFVFIDVTEQFFEKPFNAYYTAHGHAFTNIFVVSSTWLIVSMATSRYIAICHPLRAKKMISTKSTKVITCCVVLVCFLLTLPQFWENKVTKFKVEGRVFYIKHDGYLRLHRTHHLTYCYARFTIGILIPFLVLIFCNVSLLRSLRKPPAMPNRRSNYTHIMRSSGMRLLTLTLIIIVVMYIVFDIPAEMIRFLQEVAASGEHSALYNLGVAILNTLQIVNFAFNFILYCAISSQFRKCMIGLVYCDVTLPKERRRINTVKRQISYQQSLTREREHSRRFGVRNQQLLYGQGSDVITDKEEVRLNGAPHRHMGRRAKNEVDDEEVIPLKFTNGRYHGVPL